MNNADEVVECYCHKQNTKCSVCAKNPKPKRPVSRESIVYLIKNLVYWGHEMADALQSYEDSKEALHWLDLEDDAKRILTKLNEDNAE